MHEHLCWQKPMLPTRCALADTQPASVSMRWPSWCSLMSLPVAQGFAPTDTWLSIAIKIVKAHLKSYIISSSADQAAVVLYGTVCRLHIYSSRMLAMLTEAVSHRQYVRDSP